MFIKHNPILRLLLPFVLGIIAQWYLQTPLIWVVLAFVLCIGSFMLLGGKPQFRKLQYNPIRGILLVAASIAVGLAVAYTADVRNRESWLGHRYQTGQLFAVTLVEPLIPKERSFKAEAEVQYLIKNNTRQEASGKIIVYFKKDSVNKQLQAGDQILIKEAIQEIQNTGNPGAFDYKKYCLFNGITHQVYLPSTAYQKLSSLNISFFKCFLFSTRAYVLKAIKENVTGKKEQGLAEAMLIGYKEDLDKALLQSYTNTGVVHVIAVSGMHLALLYWIINLLLKPLLRRRSTKWLHPLLVLLLLWGFSLLAGGAASIVRAAVMFTFITIGSQINRTTSIYNILGVSAFCQLCYNPYWLWDVGFQLSYMAVLSIVVFYKPIYHLLFVKNKMLDWVWQLTSVSIAAQILTTPFALYYFHQFPVYFLISNLVVVPVSSMILIGILVLVVLSPIKIVASFIGYLLNGLIWWLNTFIEQMEHFPFAVWTGIYTTLAQSILLLTIITGISFWMIEKYKLGLWVSLCTLLIFFSIRSYSFYKAEKQQKIIVYNANKNLAIDFIIGRNYYFIGNESIQQNISMNNYVLKPSRISQRLQKGMPLPQFYYNKNAIQYKNKKILLINSSIVTVGSSKKIQADLVVLSGNPKLYIATLNTFVNTAQVVIDGTVPIKKAQYWVKDCDSLKIPCHNVGTQGAFVMNIY